MRGVRRALALAALLPCIAMAAPVTLASPTAAQVPTAAQAVTAQRRAPVGLALTKLNPKPIRENSKIEISGLARNRTDDQLSGLTMRLRYSAQPVISRGQLDQFASGQPNLLPGVGPQVPLTNIAAPGATQSWTIKTSTKELGLRVPAGAPGVYPVGVEVVNSAQQVVGGMTTFMTFMPKRRLFEPVTISWVWPLMDRMHRTNDQTFFDDQLNTDLAPGGRLGKLVGAAAATSTPITWAIDPALLDDVQTMASGDYTVKPPGGKPAKKEKSPVAASWLSSLKSASKGDPYFTVPYGDPDVVALVRHKMWRDINASFDAKYTDIASNALGRTPDAHVAWPPYGMAGGGTIGQLAGHALKDGGTFLMSSEQFENPPQGTPANATTAVQTTAGPKTALVYDEKLNEIVSKGTKTSAGAALAEQRFLAETAMIAAETPSLPRTVVVAPDRHWNPAPGLAGKLLTYTKAAPWLREAPLSRISSAQPQDRQLKIYDDDYEAYELSDAHLEQTQEIARQAATFRSVMTGKVQVSYDRAVLRLESVSWRTMPGRAKGARRTVAKELSDDMDSVRIVTTKNKRVLMGGSTGKLPVLVENTLKHQSVKVRLVAKSENTAKLQLGQLDPEDAVIELRPGERAQRWIPAKAAGNGNFEVHLALVIPDSGGRTFGRGETIIVRTTGYGRLALLITGGGLAVLFVGVGVRAIRARRRRKSEATGDGSTGMGSAGTTEQGNGFSGPGFPGPGLSAAEFPGAPGPGLPDPGHAPGPERFPGPPAGPGISGAGSSPGPGQPDGPG